MDGPTPAHMFFALENIKMIIFSVATQAEQKFAKKQQLRLIKLQI